jgi:hypothetical protein
MRDSARSSSVTILVGNRWRMLLSIIPDVTVLSRSGQFVTPPLREWSSRRRLTPLIVVNRCRRRCSQPAPEAIIVSFLTAGLKVTDGGGLRESPNSANP